MAESTSLLSSQNNTKNKSTTDKTLSGFGNLIKLLPTGTVFIFLFLNPVFTNNGNCHPINKYLSGILIAVCGVSCAFSSFTDSYVGSDRTTHYGIATIKGLWPTTSADGSVDLSKYKLRFADFVHSFLALVVFAVLSLLDSYTVECFYPSFQSNQKVLLMVLPPAIGAISGTLFMLFPNTRHGIGYPSSDSSQTS